MNERIRELALQANANELSYAYYRGEKKPENAVTLHSVDLELFAELIVAKVLDEVAERAYICGDRAWSDELDRRWVELEFGFGELAG